MASFSGQRVQGIGVAPITQLRRCFIKIVTFKGGHYKCDKSGFPYHKELLLKVSIRFLCEQILFFKRSSHSEKGLQLKRITA